MTSYGALMFELQQTPEFLPAGNEASSGKTLLQPRSHINMRADVSSNGAPMLAIVAGIFRFQITDERDSN